MTLTNVDENINKLNEIQSQMDEARTVLNKLKDCTIHDEGGEFSFTSTQTAALVSHVNDFIVLIEDTAGELEQVEIES